MSDSFLPGADKTPPTEAYQHCRLTVQSSIRVFDLHGGKPASHISGSLREVELPEDVEVAPEYTALSYTWGSSQDMSPHPIWIDGKPMRVRNNLMAALQVLRHDTDDCTYWIDAICINQDDVAEKNYQVAAMARIYRAAEAVKIWLGPDADDSAIAMTHVRDTARTLTRSTSGTSHGSSPAQEPPPPSSSTTAPPPALLAMHALLNRPYWRRAWIIQEVILAKEIDVHCGPRAVAWETLVDACRSALPPQSSPQPSSMEQQGSSSPARQLMLRREAALQDGRPLQEQTLERLICVHHECESADRRDRIFALLSLAVDCASGQGIRADYGMARFELLVQVLLFCRPVEDVLGFVVLLWRVLLREGEDGQWARAMTCWQREVADARQVAAENGGEGKGKLRVTQFVTVKSASSDWVRCTAVETCLGADTQERGYAGMNGFHAALANCDARDATPRTYASSVYAIDSHNVVIILGPYRIAVLSVNPMKAIGSPCKTLRLHLDSDSCTWSACGGLLR